MSNICGVPPQFPSIKVQLLSTVAEVELCGDDLNAQASHRVVAPGSSVRSGSFHLRLRHRPTRREHAREGAHSRISRNGERRAVGRHVPGDLLTERPQLRRQRHQRPGRRPLGPIVDSSGRMRTRRWGLRHLTRSSRSGGDRPHRFVIRDHLELDARGFEQRPLRKHRRQRIHLVGVFD